MSIDKSLQIAVSALALNFFCAIGANAVFAQGTEDVAPGAPTSFPLAAPAGQTHGAKEGAPTGAVNQGPFDMTKWKRGTRYDSPANAKIWNPVKEKLLEGKTVTSVAVNYVKDGQTYCSMANSGYDFTWTEMQHAPQTWDTIDQMWATCPHAKAVPGVRVAYTNEMEEQRALDAGALVLAVPTIRNLEEAREAVKWAYFPPEGGRSIGAGFAGTPAFWGRVPGGYRNTMNDNLVLILMIETLDGLRDVDEIAKLKGVSAFYAAASDLGSFAGYRQGDPDFEREVNIVHDAAVRNHLGLCGPMNWRGRPDFNCFYGSSEAALIQRGARDELGSLINTQGNVEVGPYAGMFDGSTASGRRGGRGATPQ